MKFTKNFIKMLTIQQVTLLKGNLRELLESLELVQQVEKQLKNKVSEKDLSQRFQQLASETNKHILKIFNKYKKPQAQPQPQQQLSKKMSQISQKRAQKKQDLHHLPSFCNQGAFNIQKIVHFQKLIFYCSSVTACQSFLYLCIGGSSGGMFKIGTGKNETNPGQVYFYKSYNLPEEQVSWVYIKGKLYLRYPSLRNNVEIICPKTFKQEGLIQLQCRELFSTTQLAQLNNKFQLLTDGNYIFMIGRTIKSKQIDLKKIQKQESESNSPELQKAELGQAENKIESKKELFEEQGVKQASRCKKSKKPSKANQEKAKEAQLAAELNQPQYQHFLEFTLYKFDITASGSDNFEESEEKENGGLAQELWESFSGLFTMEECLKSLAVNMGDIAKAASWLVDEGMEERKKRTVLLKTKTILAESEIVSTQKEIKIQELQTKPGSLIPANSVYAQNWTMDDKQIALYCENGIKIFSIFEEDEKDLFFTSIVNDTAKNNHLIGDFKYPTELEELKKVLLDESKKYEALQVKLAQQNQVLTYIQQEIQALEDELDLKPEIEDLLEEQRIKFEDTSDIIIQIKDQLRVSQTRVLKMEEVLHQVSTSSKKKIEQGKKPDVNQIKEQILDKLQDPKEKKQQKLQELEQQIKKIKTTYIKQIYNEKPFHTNPNYLITYEPEQKIFYVVNFNQNYQSLPFLVTYSQKQDVNEYPPAGRLPYILNDWEYLYVNALYQIHLEKQKLKSQTKQLLEQQPETKTLQQSEQLQLINSQKNNLIKKLNRLEEKNIEENLSKKILMEKLGQHYYQEVKKNHALCVQGSYEELLLIWSQLESVLNKLQEQNKINNDQNNKNFNNNFNKIQQQKLISLLQLMLFWVYHVDQLIIFEQKIIVSEQNNVKIRFDKIQKISQTFYNLLKEKEKENFLNEQQPEAVQLIWEIILQGFSIFAPTSLKQLSWINLILTSQNVKILQKFSEKYDLSCLEDKNAVHQQKQIEVASNKNQLLIDINKNQDFVNQFKKGRAKIRFSPFVNPFQEPLARIFLEDQSYLLNEENYQKTPYTHNFFNSFKFLELQIENQSQNQEKYVEILKEEKLKYLASKKKCPQKIKKESKKQHQTLPQSWVEKSKEAPKKNFGNIFDDENVFRKQPPQRHDQIKQLEQIEQENKRKQEILKQQQEVQKQIEENQKQEQIKQEAKKQLINDYYNKNKENIIQQSQELYNNLLQQSSIFAQEPEKLENIEISAHCWKIIRFLLEKSWEETYHIKDASQENKLKNHLILKITNLISKALSKLISNRQKLVQVLFSQKEKDETKKQALQNLINYLSQFVNFFNYLCLQSSSFYSPKQSFLQIFPQIQAQISQIFNFFKQQLVEELQEYQEKNQAQLYSVQQPGIHQGTYKIFQTSHPYEKGQQIYFDNIQWKDAIGIYIEQDPRNQSDQHDFLTISGWFGTQTGDNQTHHTNNQEGLYSCFRLTGKQQPSQKKPIFILGNNLRVDFQSQSQVRHGQDGFNLWGYRIIARPVIGTQNNSECFNELKKNIQILKNLENCEKTTLAANITLVEQFLKLPINQVEIPEKQLKLLQKLQNWVIFSNGLINNKISDYIEISPQQSKSQNLSAAQLQQQQQKQQIFQIKEEIFEQMQKLSIKKTLEEADKHVNLSMHGDFHNSTLSKKKYSYYQLKYDLFSRLYNYGKFTLKKNDSLDSEEKKEIDAEEKFNEEIQSEKIDWNRFAAQFLPHIKDYVDQIQLMQGKFVEFSLQLKAQVPVPQNYRMEKMRPNFKKQYKDLWEQAEILFILVQMYHNGLLQRDLQQSVNELIKEKITGIADTNRQVIAYMIQCIQNYKEMQFCLDSLHKKRYELNIAEKKQLKDNYLQLEKEFSEVLLVTYKQEQIEKAKQLEKIAKQKQEQKEKKESENNDKLQNDAKQQQQQSKSQKNKQIKQQKVGQQIQKMGKKVVITSKTALNSKKQENLDQSKNNQQKNEQKEEQKEKTDQEILEILKDKIQEKHNEELQKYFTEEICIGESKIKQICHAVQQIHLFNPEDLKTTSIELFKHCQHLLNSQAYQKKPENNQENKDLKQENNKEETQKNQENKENQENQEENKKTLKQTILQYEEPKYEPLNFISPYFLVAKNIIEKALFLLSLNNSVKVQEIQDQQKIQEKENQLQQDVNQKQKQQQQEKENEQKLLPPNMKRVISAPLSEKNMDKQKLQYFRQQIESYQHFKFWEKSNYEENIYQSPSYCILDFLKLNVSIDSLMQNYHNQNLECSKRIVALQALNKITSQYNETRGETQSFLNSIYQFNCFINVISSNKELKQVYIEQINQYLENKTVQFNLKFHLQIRNITHQNLIEKLSQQALSSIGLSNLDFPFTQTLLKIQNSKKTKKNPKNSSENSKKDSLNLFQDQIHDFQLQISEISSLITPVQIQQSQKLQALFSDPKNEFIYNFNYQESQKQLLQQQQQQQQQLQQQQQNNEIHINSASELPMESQENGINQQQYQQQQKQRKRTGNNMEIFSNQQQQQENEIKYSFNIQSGLQLVKNSLQIALLCQDFSYLSNQLQDLKALTQSLKHSVQAFIYKLNGCQNLNQYPEIFIKIVISLLQTELGFQNKDYKALHPINLIDNQNTENVINARILARIFDFSGINRIKFLLLTLIDLFKQRKDVKINKKKDYPIFENLAILLLTIIYHTNAPALLRQASNLLNMIHNYTNFQFKTVPTQFQYLLKHFDAKQHQENFANQNEKRKASFQKDEFDFEKDIKTQVIKNDLSQNKHPDSNISLLMEKIGFYILSKGGQARMADKIQQKIYRIIQESKYNQSWTKTSKSINQELKQKVHQKKYEEITDKYIIMGHMSEEEDLSYLIHLVFHWEKQNPTFTKKLPKNYKELSQFIVQQQEAQQLQKQQNEQAKKQHQQANVQATANIPEKIIQNLPYFIGCCLENQEEIDLPLGWQLNFSGIFKDFQTIFLQHKEKLSKIQTPAKSTWSFQNLTKLYEKYTYLLKNYQKYFINLEKDEKEQEKCVKFYNFVLQIIEHLKTIRIIGNLLNILGFAPLMGKLFNYEQALEWTKIFNYATNKRIQKISITQYENGEEMKTYSEILDLDNLDPKVYQQSIIDLKLKEESEKREKIEKENALKKKEQEEKLKKEKEEQDLFEKEKQELGLEEAEKLRQEREKAKLQEQKEKQMKMEKEQKEKEKKEKEQKEKELKEKEKKEFESKQPSNLTVMIVEANIFTTLEQGKLAINEQESIPKHDNFYQEINFNQLLHSTMARTGYGTSSMIQELIQLTRQLLKSENQLENFNQFLEKGLEQLIQNQNSWKKISNDQKSIIIGVLTSLAGWNQSLQQSAKVKFTTLIDQEEYILGAGGIQSGQTKSGIYSKNDPTLTVQYMKNEDLKPTNSTDPSLSQNINQKFHFYEKLVQAIIVGVSQPKQNNDRLILRALLQIASQINWQSEDAQAQIQMEQTQAMISKLNQLASLCPSNIDPSSFETQFVSAWQVYVEKQQEALQQVQVPYYNINFLDNEENQEQSSDSEEYLDDEEESAQKKKNLAEKTYSFINYQVEVPSLKKEPSKISNLQESCKNFSMAVSSYNDSLKETEEKIPRNYVLQHWKKHIFPKVEAYCKGTLQSWEVIMSIAQISGKILQGNITDAINDLYIVCDQKPPPGCDTQTIMAHCDTKTLPLDEIKIGEQYLVNLVSKNNPENIVYPFLADQNNIQNKLLPILVIDINQRSSSVQVLYQDNENSQVYSFWVHVSQIQIPSVPLPKLSNSLPISSIKKKLYKKLNNSVQLYARQVILNFFDQQISQETKINLNQNKVEKLEKPIISNLNHITQLLQWTVFDELSNDFNRDWLKANGNKIQIGKLEEQQQENEPVNQQFQKIHNFQNMLLKVYQEQSNNSIIPELVKWAENELKKTIQFIKNKSYFADLKRQNPKNPYQKQQQDENISDNNDILPLNIHQANSTISQIIVVFKSDSRLLKGSGLNIFQDPHGQETIQGIHAGKTSEKRNISPLVFNGSQIYTQYYFDQSSMPGTDRDDTDRSKLECLIYLIPTNWRVVCWLIDTLGNVIVNQPNETSIKLLQQLNKILTQNFEQMNGPNILKQILAILITRNTHKLVFALEKQKDQALSQDQLKILSVEESFVKSLLEQINDIKQKEEEEGIILSSSTLQDYAELAATILCPIGKNLTQNQTQYLQNPSKMLPNNIQIPKSVFSIINTMVIINYINKFTSQNKDLTNNKQKQNTQNKQEKNETSTQINQLPITEQIYQRAIQNMNQNSQNQNKIICIDNLPPHLGIAELKQDLLKTLVKLRARIFNVENDIFIPKNPDFIEKKQEIQIQNEKEKDEIEVNGIQENKEELDFNQKFESQIKYLEESTQEKINEILQKKPENQIEHLGLAFIIIDEMNSIGYDKEQEQALEEEEEKQAEDEKDIEEEEQEEDNSDKFWACPICTVHNEWDNVECNCCQSPAPENKQPVVEENQQQQEEPPKKEEKDGNSDEEQDLKELQDLNEELYQRLINGLEKHYNKIYKVIFDEKTTQIANKVLEKEKKTEEINAKWKKEEEEKQKEQLEKGEKQIQDGEQIGDKQKEGQISSQQEKQDQQQMPNLNQQKSSQAEKQKISKKQKKQLKKSKKIQREDHIKKLEEERRQMEKEILEKIEEEQKQNEEKQQNIPIEAEQNSSNNNNQQEKSEENKEKDENQDKKEENQDKQEENLDKKGENQDKKAENQDKKIEQQQEQQQYPLIDQGLQLEDSQQLDQEGEEQKFLEELLNKDAFGLELTEEQILQQQEEYERIKAEEQKRKQSIQMAASSEKKKQGEDAQNLEKEANLEQDKKEEADKPKVLTPEEKINQLKEEIQIQYNLVPFSVKVVFGQDRIQEEGKYEKYLNLMLKFRLCVQDIETKEFKLKKIVEKTVLEAFEELFNLAQQNEEIQEILSDIQGIFMSLEQELEIPEPESITKENPFSKQTNLIEIMNKTVADYPSQIFDILKMLGYDLWLNKSILPSFQKPQICSLQILFQLVQFVENSVCKKSKQTLDYSPAFLRFINLNNILFEDQQSSSENYYNHQSLLEYNQLIHETQKSVLNLKYSWSILRILNKNLQTAIQYINFLNSNSESQFEINEQSVPLGICNYISELRNITLNQIKNDLCNQVLKQTAKERKGFSEDSAPKVKIDRLKIAASQKESQEKQQQQKDNDDMYGNSSEKQQSLQLQLGKNKSDFIFVKAFNQLKDIPREQMRPANDPFISFEIILQGESAQGYQGLYRQFFSDVSAELQPSGSSNINRNLNLLIPCENNASEDGENQDKFVINPNAKTQQDLQLFEFLGVLMGVCIRTGVNLALDLPPLFWKQIVGEKITPKDLEEIEQSFQNISKIIKTSSKESLEQEIADFGLTFHFQKQSQQQNQLNQLNQQQKEKSDLQNQKQVTFENRFEFLYSLFQNRIQATSLQVQFIQKGLHSLIPEPLLKVISHSDLQYMVCGSKSIDLEMLKRHTNYKAPLKENSDVVRFFWEAVGEFSELEKIKLIKFCWAQERLPASDQEYEKKQISLALKLASQDWVRECPDKYLPRADTCFFNLELPNYSSKEVTKRQILLAISFDNDAIDADANPNNGQRGGRRRSIESDEEEE
ncbi:HECT-domain-containing protein [Pseudocohnilembus persalinus]|uniref:HECT-domain-containing protein n=1 Tax=Pseudocohnilembus persalinus TaxID=266149 RepID=A0A0V0QKY0_PSEPJ|nr:HECT-domain-containing protein [Pseudocohnilembus persalinus]|eukprot:KRX02870.1 HECT-domain-containing protein [Pseudocohnilembus persalinus]